MEQTPIRSPEIGAPVIPSVEQAPNPERPSETQAATDERSGSEQGIAIAPVTPAVLTPVVSTVSANLHQQIESILSEGLQVEYEQLDPATQERFRTTGETTASQIEVLVQSTKVQVQKIIALIITWLKILPGVNTFFLEQEAKIKADKILKLQE